MITLILSSLSLLFFFKRWFTTLLCYFLLIFYLVLNLKHDHSFFIIYANRGLDNLALILIILTIWLIFLIVLASWKIKINNPHRNLFLLVLSFLLLILIWTFSVRDFLHFYLLFESSLIPTFILILGWGYQPERIQAGVYILLYTLFASLPFLTSILLWNRMVKTTYIYFPSLESLSSVFWIFSFTLAFLVKLPLYITHLWLPKAHVEAPVAGSIILAGILLKLGGYGLIRVLPKLKTSFSFFNYIFFIWAIIGGVLIRLICICQTDIKFLIALSSVAHIALVAGGCFSLRRWGLNGAIIIIVGHGLCSSGLFALANIIYERTSTRSLSLSKGIQTVIPSFTFWIFLLTSSNIAAPPSLNLLGEIHVIIRVLSWSKIFILPLAWLTFFAAAYSLFLFTATQHGKISSLQFSFKAPNNREFLTLFLHWIPLNILIIDSTLLQSYFC